MTSEEMRREALKDALKAMLKEPELVNAAWDLIEAVETLRPYQFREVVVSVMRAKILADKRMVDEGQDAIAGLAKQLRDMEPGAVTDS